MKTLYVSDLDATLLNEHAQLSQETKDILRPLIDSGMNFTVATARTPATAVDLLRPLNVKLPIIAMGGAMVYDMQTNQTLNANNLPQDAVEDICDMLEIVGQSALAYTVENGTLCVYYKQIESDIEREFVDSRKGSPYKKFVKIEDYFTALNNKEVIMFLFCMPDLRKIYTYYDFLSAIPGLMCNLYPYEYNNKGYILEVFRMGTGKGEALKQMKQQFNIDKIIAFGDNYNDISMFQMADESYAVENAIDDLKQIASKTIGEHKNNSVATFIKNHYENHAEKTY